MSSALGSTVRDTDDESIDLNDMDDAEAERLDNVISTAFQSMGMKFGGNNKKTKAERITQTSVMHFRIRVLDLIEIYLKTKPSLAITLEILLELINMTELSRGNKDLQPLSARLDRILKTLFSLREFSNVEDVTETQLSQLIESLLDRKIDAAAFDSHHKLLSKIAVFAINAAGTLTNAEKVTTKSPLFVLLDEKLRTLLQKKKNYVINVSTFNDILKIRWHGVWLLAQSIAKYGLLAEHNAKAIRRAQALELLSIVYKNHGFIQHKLKELNKTIGSVERDIETYAKWLNERDAVKTAEFAALLNLLLDVHKFEAAEPTVKSKLDWKLIGSCVQNVRKTTAVPYQIYVALCNRLDLSAIKNADTVVQKSVNSGKVNGNGNNVAVDSDNNEERVAEEQPQQNGKRKRKAPDIGEGKAKGKPNAKKLKKLKKMERLKLASTGLDEISFNFNQSGNGQEDSD